MADHESTARANHRNGMNCAMAVYGAFADENKNRTVPPRPRAEGGVCGAVLAAEQIIREMGGTEEDIAEFERRFKEQHNFLKCGQLRGMLTGKCNDYVGTAAAILEDMKAT